MLILYCILDLHFIIKNNQCRGICIMKSTTKSDKSKETAISLALSELNLTEKDVEIEVLQEAKGGFMGMFSKPFTIKVTEKETTSPNPVNDNSKKDFPKNPKGTTERENLNGLNDYEKTTVKKVKEYLTDITTAMDLNINSFKVKKIKRGIIIDIEDGNKGTIIGKRGELLDSFDHLINIIANNDANQEYVRLILDSNNYRKNKEDNIRDFAKKVSLIAIKTKKIRTLEPMKSYERRLVHSVIQDIDGVTSYSIGKEPYRKVIIKPDNYLDKKDNYKSVVDHHKPKRTPEENTRYVKSGVDSMVKLKIFDESNSSKPLSYNIELDNQGK